MDTIYRCFFEFDGESFSADSVAIDRFINGFWVDENFNYKCVAANIKYWIPPSRILFIEKILIAAQTTTP